MIATFTITAAYVPWIALGVAIATFVASQREVRRRAKVDYVNQLETRIETCEAERERLRKEGQDARREIATLKDENFDLMRRMSDLER
jgi:chromosome segregation ATPase